MLHNRSISSTQKLLQQLWVLGEFGLETSPHDSFLGFGPVRPEWVSALISTIERFIGSGCADDVLFLGLAFELLGLEEVLIGGVLIGSDCERRGVDVAEFTVVVGGEVEVYGFLFLHE